MRRQLSAFCNFHLRIRAAASAGPWHHVMTLVHLASVEALLQKRPDRFVVLRGEREVAATPFRVPEFLDELMCLAGGGLTGRCCDRYFGVGAKVFGQGSQKARVIPVHPVTKTLRLFRLASRKPEDSAFAFVDEVINPVLMDGRLRSQAQLLFDFDLDPQTLAIEAILVALVMPGHCEEALVRILIRAAPCMMNAHWVIRRDGSIEEAPSLAPGVLLPQLAEDLSDFPELQNGMLTGNKIAVSNGLKHDWKTSYLES